MNRTPYDMVDEAGQLLVELLARTGHSQAQAPEVFRALALLTMTMNFFDGNIALYERVESAATLQ